jgi:hypothetical protein
LVPFSSPACRNRLQLKPLGFATKLVYGFGTVAYGIKDNGFNFLLLIFFNQLLGLPAQRVGFAIMIGPLPFASRPAASLHVCIRPALRAGLLLFMEPAGRPWHRRAVLVSAADGDRGTYLDCLVRGPFGGAIG